MASLDADPNSDDDLEFLTIEEVDGAENRDDELQSDIDVSDTDVSSSEEEGEPEVLNGHGDSDFDSEDDLPLADVAGRRWRSTLTPRTLRPFTGPRPGPTRQLSAAANELDFFHIFFNEDLYSVIANETNAYAQKCRQAGQGTRQWYPTSAAEIKAFVGALTVMGVLPAPCHDMYWLKDKMYHLSVLESKFTRDRFEHLQRFLHITDTSNNPPSGQPGHDRLCHVRPLIERVATNCRNSYNASMEVSVDEAMVAFSGRLCFKQYLPLKPTKRGIKVWMRADPNNGYLNDFQIYTGRVSNNTEKDLSSRVLMDLVRPIANKGHHIYCDSFFSSPALFKQLVESGTYACGTVKSNRKGMPLSLRTTKLKTQGEMVQLQKGELLATAWRDKRTLNVLSTNTSNQPLTSVKRKQKDGAIKDVPCPQAIKLYNQFMNGVDRADQLRSSYPTGRKAMKWWKYLFHFLLDVCLVNAFVLMRQSANHQLKTKTGRVRTLQQLEYRMKLGHRMLDTFSTKRKRSVSLQETPTPPAHHWPLVNGKRKLCKMCSRNGKRSEPVTACEQCKIHLCIKCFKAYHIVLFRESEQ